MDFSNSFHRVFNLRAFYSPEPFLSIEYFSSILWCENNVVLTVAHCVQKCMCLCHSSSYLFLQLADCIYILGSADRDSSVNLFWTPWTIRGFFLTIKSSRKAFGSLIRQKSIGKPILFCHCLLDSDSNCNSHTDHRVVARAKEAHHLNMRRNRGRTCELRI